MGIVQRILNPNSYYLSDADDEAELRAYRAHDEAEDRAAEDRAAEAHRNWWTANKEVERARDRYLATAKNRLKKPEIVTAAHKDLLAAERSVIPLLERKLAAEEACPGFQKRLAAESKPRDWRGRVRAS